MLPARWWKSFLGHQRVELHHVWLLGEHLVFAPKNTHKTRLGAALCINCMSIQRAYIDKKRRKMRQALRTHPFTLQ